MHLYLSQHSEISLVSVKLGACFNRHWALEDTMVGSGGPLSMTRRRMYIVVPTLHGPALFQMMRWLEPGHGNSISDYFFFGFLMATAST
jgi:hypothetical protein